MSTTLPATVFTAAALCASTLVAREWTDATGKYSLEAELVAADDDTVVLQRADHDLVAVPIDQLSEEDRKYLATGEAKAAEGKWTEGLQTWKLRNGQEIVGRLVDYTSRDVTIERRRRRIYVNDRVLDNLPEFYQQIVPAIVAHFEKLPRADRRGLQNWLTQQGDRPHRYRVDGVVLETENGDEYGVPFFLFNDEDLAVLKPGWNESLARHASDDFAAQQQQAFLLSSLAAARHHDRLVQREIALMQLKLQAVDVGLTSLWEVTLHPGVGTPGPSMWVVVSGRDSRQAAETALQQNPGFVAGPVRRVSRSPGLRR